MKEETSPYYDLNSDKIQHDYILMYTRPDIYIISSKLTEAPESLEIETSELNMQVSLAYAYSIDNESTWSRYYLPEEKSKFLQLARDAYFKPFDVHIKIRIEVQLDESLNEETTKTVDERFDESLPETEYWCKVTVVNLNSRPLKITNQWMVNTSGITLQKQEQLFNPYANMDAAFAIQEQTAEAINNMFGHWCYYFKTSPDETTKNITLKSYTLHNVVAMKKIKISIPGNKLPDSKNIYSEWGIELPDEFNCHILNSVFQRAFGQDKFPHEKDYLYLPLTGMMYEINSYYENRNFMYKPLWSECILLLYEDNKNVIKNEFEDETFEYAELKDVGGLTIEEEIETQSADPNYLNTQLLEAFRLRLHKQTEIVNYEMIYNQIKLFDNMYLFSGVPVGEVGVAFDCKKTLSDNLSISFHFEFEKLLPSRRLLQLIDTNKRCVGYIEIVKTEMHIYYQQFHLVFSHPIAIQTRYAITLNISGMYRFVEAFVYQLLEDKFVLYDTSKIDIDIMPIGIDSIELLGGKTLISNIGLDTKTYTTDDAIKRLTQVTPNAKFNVFFDKAFVPISDSKSNGY